MPRGYVGPDVEGDDSPAEPQQPATAKPRPGAAPNPNTGVYKHAQYNSPLRMYSAETAKEQFNIQSGGAVDVAGVNNRYVTDIIYWLTVVVLPSSSFIIYIVSW